MRDADAVWFLDNLVITRLSGAATGGRVCVLEVRGPPGDTVPRHVHRREDECFVVLEGRLTIHQPGRVLSVPEGAYCVAARDVPHTYRVTDEGPARWLVVAMPAGFEAFVAAIGEPARALTLPDATVAPDPEKLAAIAARFGIELLPDDGYLQQRNPVE